MNAARGEAGLRIAGEMLVLRPSFAALVAAESEVGPLFALVERAAEGRLAMSEMVALFWHCLIKRPLPREEFAEAVGGRAGGGDAGAEGAARADSGGAVMAEHFGPAALRLAGVMLRFGWSPDSFWNATPADVRALCAGEGDGMDREALATLMEAFPDG